jgi:type II secretory pathway predicted ATPase ExeA
MFTIDVTLLQHAQKVFSQYRQLYWVVGGAGSGKTTVCRALDLARIWGETAVPSPG